MDLTRSCWVSESCFSPELENVWSIWLFVGMLPFPVTVANERKPFGGHCFRGDHPYWMYTSLRSGQIILDSSTFKYCSWTPARILPIPMRSCYCKHLQITMFVKVCYIHEFAIQTHVLILQIFHGFSNLSRHWDSQTSTRSTSRRLNFMREALQCMDAKQDGEVPVEWWPRNVSRHHRSKGTTTFFFETERCS